MMRGLVARAGLGVAHALLLFTLAGAVAAQELVFASVEEGRRVLGTRDEYVVRQSPFDRAVRLKSDRAVNEREYLDFVARAVLPWSPEEQAAIEAGWKPVVANALRIGLPVPARVLIVKSSGADEGNTPYTRANAIVVPAELLKAPPALMQRLLAHELFHVVSRATPALAAPLYATIGFQFCGEVGAPAPIDARRITNPDAPRNEVRVGGASTWVVPLLYSPKAYDRAQGGGLFEYMQLAFRRVTRPADGHTPWPAVDDALLPLDALGGYFEQVGRNTTEVIHPEEIVAENVASLITGERNVPSPEVLSRIEAALRAIARR